MRARARAPVDDASGMPVLSFQVAGKSFAVELTRVQQVIEFRELTRTPRRPPFVEGVIPHGGEFVAVISMRKRLGHVEAGPPRPPIVLLSGIGEDRLVGMMVDQVLRVLPLPRDGVLAPPPRVFGIRAEFIRGVANAGGRPVVWLEAAKLLTSTEPVTLLA